MHAAVDDQRAPVTNELSELARYSTERAISSGQACRASGMRASKMRAARSGGAPVADVSIARWNSVLGRPGVQRVDPDPAAGHLLRPRCA